MTPDDAVQQPHDIEDFAGLYVGLDVSLTSTGIAVLNGERLTTWNLVPGDRLRDMRRLDWYWNKFDEFLRCAGPSVVCLENYAFGKSNKAHQIGELGGLVRLMLWQRCVPTYLVAPATLKKFVTGVGKGGKTGIPLHLYKRWGVTVDQEDQADAAGLALMAMHTQVHSLELTKAQGEALAAISVLRGQPRLIRSRNRVNPGAQNS